MSTDSSNPHRVILRGLPAVLSCIAIHPKSLREIHASPKCVPSLSPHIIPLESQGVKLHTSSATVMSNIAGVECHDICAVTMRPEPGHVRVSDFSDWRESHETVVIADHVSRPADLAAIARTMSSFGIKNLLLSSGTENLAFDSDTWTLAEGAMEQVRIMRAAALGGLLKLVKDKCCVVGLTKTLDENRPRNSCACSRTTYRPIIIRKRARY